jgi:RNase P/RNase MRP subunit POP5
MSVVDVSRIPNNNKFDPVREAILQLEGIIESETAGVFSVNGEQGTLTLQAGTNITITNPSEGVIQIASSAGAGGIEGELTLAAGDGITLSSPTVFDGTENVTITITNDDRPNAGVLTLVAGSGITTVGASEWEEEPQTWVQQGRIWSVSEGNTFSANEISNKSITLTHGDTSSAASSSNTNGVVIQSLGIDEFGHTQSIATTDLDNRYLQLSNANVADWDEAYSWGDHALEGYLTSFTETDPTVPSHVKSITITNIANWNAAYNDKINSASFNTGDGVLTLTQQDGGTVTVDLDGRYSTTTVNNYVSVVSFSTATGILTLDREGLSSLSVDLDGRYLTSFTETDPTVPSHVKSITTTNISNWNDAYNDQIVSASFNTTNGVLTLTQQDAGTVTVDLDGRYSATDTNNYVSSVTFSTSTGVLTLNREGLSALTVDLDGKYLNIGDKAADANLLDGLDSTYFLNYNNLTNKPTIPTVNNNTITIAAGGAMTGGGAFTVNQNFNETITISHADTSSQGSVNNSGTTFVQDITLDTYGHVTFIDSASVSIPTVYDSVITLSAGGGMTGGGSFGINQSFNETITISHADTSALSGTYGSTDDSVKIDTITVDGNGHITAITTGPVAGTGGSTPNNSVIQIAAGSGLGGGGVFTLNQSFGETITLTHADTSSQASVSNSSNTFIQSITLDTYGHILGITSGTATTGGTGGVGGSGITNYVAKWSNSSNLTTGILYDSGSFVGVNTVSPVYTLDVSGTIRATNDIIAFSDARVKENIEPIKDAVEKVMCLRGVSYNKIGEDKRSIGVIAQEVENIVPEVVHTAEDDMKAVAYGNMVGLLIEAIKEQQAQIEQLKATVDYLKSK